MKKKKKAYRDKKECWKGSTLAIGSNVERFARKKHKDISQITYFDYNKKGYYSMNCIKPTANN